MKTLTGLAAALAMSLASGAASAALLTTTVTADGAYANALSNLNDGVIPDLGYLYQNPQSTYFGNGNTFGVPVNTEGPEAVFTFDFGGRFLISNLFASLDNNDSYIFTFFDGATQSGSVTILVSDGSISGGLDQFTRTLTTPLAATKVTLQGSGGDHRYGIGEAQFTGTAVVPEPATWAMMIVGFGAVGASLRGRRRFGSVAA